MVHCHHKSFATRALCKRLYYSTKYQSGGPTNRQFLQSISIGFGAGTHHRTRWRPNERFNCPPRPDYYYNDGLRLLSPFFERKTDIVGWSAEALGGESRPPAVSIFDVPPIPGPHIGWLSLAKSDETTTTSSLCCKTGKRKEKSIILLQYSSWEWKWKYVVVDGGMTRMSQLPLL